MSTLKSLGNAPHLVSAAIEGITLAGIPEDKADAAFATFAGSERGKKLVRDLLFRDTLDLAKSEGRIADWFDLGNGDIFIVDEYKEFEVDDSISVEEIEKRMNVSKSDWEYLGTAPSGGIRKVKMAIGRLNHGWTEEQVTDILARPNCPLKGTGAWVREGYLKASPNYDGKDPLFFPEKQTSRWRYVRGGDVYFPYAWRDDDRRWDRDLGWVTYGRGASYRLCLLCE